MIHVRKNVGIWINIRHVLNEDENDERINRSKNIHAKKAKENDKHNHFRYFV